VPPDGGPRPFTGQIFEKTALRGRGIRVAVKSLALPNVEPGSIIDIRYKLVADTTGGSSRDAEDILDTLGIKQAKPPEGDIGKGMKLISFPAETWDVQDELFTRKAKFVYIQSGLIVMALSAIFDKPASLMWFARRMPGCSPVIKGSRIEFEAENIPAFEAEDFMAPEESSRMGLDLYYCCSQYRDPQAYWAAECRNWQKAAERFIGDPRKLAETSREIVGGETDPVEQLRKLYERAQGIRNLSYEKRLTSKERKAQKIKDNRKAADVLERDYGFRSDITRAFVALAQAAGFKAEAVRVATRDDKLFLMSYLSFAGQLDSEMALVELNGKEMLFDPATPFCPFGLIHWSRTDTAAVHFTDEPHTFFRTSVYPPEMALTQREVLLQLDTQGTLAGTVKTTYTGHEALVRRLDHIDDDREEIRESLEAELSDLLPMGAGVTMTQVDNIDNNVPSLIVQYEVTIPGIVASAGDRMLLPASPLTGTGRYPFRHAERRYPVYFPYPFREFNDIVVTLPEGVTVETRPEPRKYEGHYSSFSLVCVPEGPQKLHVQRDLVIQKSYFPVAQYGAIKAFYDKVRTIDEEQILLGKEK
jgi:hypothetical protein